MGFSVSDLVLYEAVGTVARITLNRPDRLNALSAELYADLSDCVARAASDPEIRAVVLTGAGRGFCAGADLGGLAAADTASAAMPSQTSRQLPSVHRQLYEMPKVTVAAINGPCAGAGLSLACATDLRVCAETAVFTTAFLGVGRAGDLGVSWTLPRIVGDAKAREMLLFSERIDAAEALEIRLVKCVLADDELLSYAMERAAKASMFAPLSVAAVKANLADSLERRYLDVLEREAGRHRDLSATEDAAEAVRAHLERRPPHFQGR